MDDLRTPEFPINLPTTIGGERVACLFPCIGGAEHTQFVDAQVVTVVEVANGVKWFHIHLFKPTSGGGRVITREGVIHSFPEAIREARKLAGWG